MLQLLYQCELKLPKNFYKLAFLPKHTAIFINMSWALFVLSFLEILFLSFFLNFKWQLVRMQTFKGCFCHNRKMLYQLFSSSWWSLSRGSLHIGGRCTLSLAVEKEEKKLSFSKPLIKNQIDNCTSSSAPSPWIEISTLWVTCFLGLFKLN